MAKSKQKTVVVARLTGYYGDTIRERGERFGLRKPSDFSEKWMVDPNDPKQAEEARLLGLEFKANNPTRVTDVSDDVIMSEVAQSGGALAALDQKNKALQRQVEELKAQLVNKEGANDDAGTSESDLGSEDAAGGESGKEPSEGDGRGDTGPEKSDGGDETRTRPTRRRRS